MNQRENSPACERELDLIAYLYGETDEREAQDFQCHLQECKSCRDDVESLGGVRKSITGWREEALAGFIATPAGATQPQTKSALAALRQFFDLSPLWLKGATAFAAVTFCVMVGLVVFRSSKDGGSPPHITPGTLYTAQEVDLKVKEALALQESVKPAEMSERVRVITAKSPRPKQKTSSRTTPSTQFANSQRPLSKEEREQLATELRLVSSADAPGLNLIEDRFNR